MRSFSNYSKIECILRKLDRLNSEVTGLEREMGNYTRPKDVAKNERRLIDSLRSFSRHAKPQSSLMRHLDMNDEYVYSMTISQAIKKVNRLRGQMFDMLDVEYDIALDRINLMVDGLFARIAVYKSSAMVRAMSTI